jgi:hypothetical protein
MKPKTVEDNQKCFAWVLLRVRYPLPSNADDQQQKKCINHLKNKLNQGVLLDSIVDPIPLYTTNIQNGSSTW